MALKVLDMDLGVLAEKMTFLLQKNVVGKYSVFLMRKRNEIERYKG